MSVIVTTNRRGFPVHDIIHVHPNDVQRFGVKHVLREAELHIVASVSYAAECLAAMKSYPNAVVLTEIVFGGTLDLTVLIQVKKEGRLAVVFSESENPLHVLCAREENALDYIFFSDGNQELVRRLSLAAKKRVQGDTFPDPRKLPNTELTPRENDVIRQLALGLSNKEIGHSMGISYETAKEHVQHILRKLGLGDRCQAAVWWVRKELQKQTA